MGCISNGEIAICGNFAKVTRRKPKNFKYDRDASWIEPFRFKWRAKLGKVECDCTEMETRYAPYYGFTWYHMADCAIGKHLKKHPGIHNLLEVLFPVITWSE